MNESLSLELAVALPRPKSVIERLLLPFLFALCIAPWALAWLLHSWVPIAISFAFCSLLGLALVYMAIRGEQVLRTQGRGATARTLMGVLIVVLASVSACASASGRGPYVPTHACEVRTAQPRHAFCPAPR